MCCEKCEEQEEGGEQVSPPNHPCHLIIMMMMMMVVMPMLMMLMMMYTYSLSVDGVNSKEKSRNKGETRWHAQTTPIVRIVRIFR